MKICLLSGAGEPRYSANKSMYYALKRLGHEVLFCGPGYFGRFEADILLEDRPHPEYYSYEEILSKLPWMPDACVCIEPHGFFTGPKPTNLRSAIYITDLHRAAASYVPIIQSGCYDMIFNAQKYFEPLLKPLNIPVHWLPTAFDEERFTSLPEENPVCDIVFVGNSGICGLVYDEEDELGRYATKFSGDDHALARFASMGLPSFDYAERAEMLLRLMKDFRVRIYEPLYDERYAQALRKGEIVFNRSILQDIGTRTFEALASGRLLVTDEVPHLDWNVDDPPYNRYPHHPLMRDVEHCLLYKTFFAAFYDNFRLEYELVRDRIRYYLGHPQQMERISSAGYKKSWRDHKWTDRASVLIKEVCQ